MEGTLAAELSADAVPLIEAYEQDGLRRFRVNSTAADMLSSWVDSFHVVAIAGKLVGLLELLGWRVDCFVGQ
jgi:hypothetical protein